MTQGPRRRRTDGWSIKSIRFSFVAITVVFLVVLLVFAKLVHDVQSNSTRINHLVSQNTQFIFDIQNSRLESCKRTYEGIRKVFKPFSPPKPRTEKQQSNLDKFDKTINHLKAACETQVLPPKASKIRKNQ